MVSDGPRKVILITNMATHVAKKKKESDFAQLQDWDNARCDKCYLNWLYVNKVSDSWACTGNPDNAVCIDYGPPVLPHVQAANQKALRAFVNKGVDKDIFDKQFKTFEH